MKNVYNIEELKTAISVLDPFEDEIQEDTYINIDLCKYNLMYIV